MKFVVHFENLLQSITPMLAATKKSLRQLAKHIPRSPTKKSAKSTIRCCVLAYQTAGLAHSQMAATHTQPVTWAIGTTFLPTFVTATVRLAALILLLCLAAVPQVEQGIRRLRAGQILPARLLLRCTKCLLVAHTPLTIQFLLPANA